MKQEAIVTRFAPSPTGYMHIGNLRTALYAYLIAKKGNGKFILRIEDTDRQRLVEDAVQIILDTLKAAHIQFDEGPDIGGENGPYVQSERLAIYHKYAKQLVDAGKAYYCFCTKEEMQARTGGENAGYDRHCRELSEEEIQRKLAEGVPYVIRQKTPLTGSTTFSDCVFGDITVDNSELTDDVLLKSDGYPTYNFAHVVDDHLMGVTHVVRGSEYLASSPRHVILHDAFGWQRPTYVQLPLLMGKNEDGSFSKLSKRHGAVSFQELVKDGYLPDAIVNYIAFLGWSPKNAESEILSIKELEALFSIEEISKSPSVFDYDKLSWFNKAYISALPFEEFCALALPCLKGKDASPEMLREIAALQQSRIHAIPQVAEGIDFFFTLPDYDAQLFVNKKNKTTLENSLAILNAVWENFSADPAWDAETLYERLKGIAEALDVKANSVMWAVRVAVSGMNVTPGGATDIMRVIGREESLRRIKLAKEKLAGENK